MKLINSSRIQLVKSGESIEITIFPLGLSQALILWILVFSVNVVFFYKMGFFNSIAQAPIFIRLAIICFIIIFGVVPILIRFLTTFFASSHLRIDRQTIRLCHTLFGFQYEPCQSAPRSSIEKLKIVRKVNGFWAPSRLTIWAANTPFELGGNLPNGVGETSRYFVNYGILSEPQLEWLGEELSEWLNLPMSSD